LFPRLCRIALAASRDGGRPMSALVAHLKKAQNQPIAHAHTEAVRSTGSLLAILVLRKI